MAYLPAPTWVLCVRQRAPVSTMIPMDALVDQKKRDKHFLLALAFMSKPQDNASQLQRQFLMEPPFKIYHNAPMEAWEMVVLRPVCRVTCSTIQTSMIVRTMLGEYARISTNHLWEEFRIVKCANSFPTSNAKTMSLLLLCLFVSSRPTH